MSISASTDAGGAPEVYGIVSNHTLWAYHAATGAWTELSTGYFQSISAGPGGQVFAVAREDAVNDLWQWSGATWTRVSRGNFSSLSAGTDLRGDPVVYAIVVDGTLWSCHAVTGVWAELSVGNFQSVSADGTGDVVGTLADNAVWEYSLAYGGASGAYWKNLGAHLLAVSVARS